MSILVTILHYNDSSCLCIRWLFSAEGNTKELGGLKNMLSSLLEQQKLPKNGVLGPIFSNRGKKTL